jgi:hypothetical protein
MKRLITTTIALLVLFNIRVAAQQEVYLNVSNALLYEFNMGYEHGLSDYVSIVGFGGYVYGFPDQSQETKFWYLGPEVRYYASPKNGADRFYFGFYMRAKSGFAETEFYEGGEDPQTGYYESSYSYQNQDYFKLAVGFTVGAKWITRNNLTYGLFAGFGRNLIADYDETNFQGNPDDYTPGSYYSGYYRSDLDSEYWDLRVGFNLGWRF